MIGMIIGALTAVADKIWPDATEREENLAKIKLAILDNETEITKEAAKTVRAEIQGESWLQRSWRPITMLWFLVLISGYWFGLTPVTIAPAIVESLFTLVQIGLGGYVIGRSAEKITKTATGSGIVEKVTGAFRRG
jgi:hypothetical protein